MNESKAKEQRKLQVMADQAEPEDVAKEQAKAIAKMYEDRDNKALGAKERLLSQLKVTVQKYRTANGVMSALDTVRTVLGDKGENVYSEIQMAQRLAKGLAVVAEKMAKEAEGMVPDEMEGLCDGFYKQDMTTSSVGPEDLAKQLMILQLCQNVGPAAQDITDFCTTADEEIMKARQSLLSYCEENGLGFEELCGPHDNCPSCLCMSCEKDCKEGKQIEVGQSAYEVCKDFVEQE